MFNNKKIKELEIEVKRLCNKLQDLKSNVDVWTYMYIETTKDNYSYIKETQKIHIATVLEDLLKTLGYEITYEYKPEKEKYSLKKVSKKKIKKEEEKCLMI